jgi:hypothetical protein
MLYDVSADPAVRTAIERLYAVFARYPLRKHLIGCPHCFSERDDRALHSAPLREMPEEKLTMFSWKTMTTWGDVRDFKHFFPRLCELSTASDDLTHFGIWLFKRKLDLASYAAWPEDERDAFGAFLLAWWRALLRRGEAIGEVDVRLLFAADADAAVSLHTLAAYVDDLRPFLAALLDAHTLPAKAYALAT